MHKRFGLFTLTLMIILSGMFVFGEEVYDQLFLTNTNPSNRDELTSKSINFTFDVTYEGPQESDIDFCAVEQPHRVVDYTIYDFGLYGNFSSFDTNVFIDWQYADGNYYILNNTNSVFNVTKEEKNYYITETINIDDPSMTYDIDSSYNFIYNGTNYIISSQQDDPFVNFVSVYDSDWNYLYQNQTLIYDSETFIEFNTNGERYHIFFDWDEQAEIFNMSDGQQQTVVVENPDPTDSYFNDWNDGVSDNDFIIGAYQKNESTIWLVIENTTSNENIKIYAYDVDVSTPNITLNPGLSSSDRNSYNIDIGDFIGGWYNESSDEIEFIDMNDNKIRRINFLEQELLNTTSSVPSNGSSVTIPYTYDNYGGKSWKVYCNATNGTKYSGDFTADFSISEPYSGDTGDGDTGDGDTDEIVKSSIADAYWRQDDDTDDVWVNLSIPANTEMVIKLSSGGSEENPLGVFEIFDDFNNGSYDPSQWQADYLYNDSELSYNDGAVNINAEQFKSFTSQKFYDDGGEGYGIVSRIQPHELGSTTLSTIIGFFNGEESKVPGFGSGYFAGGGVIMNDSVSLLGPNPYSQQYTLMTNTTAWYVTEFYHLSDRIQLYVDDTFDTEIVEDIATEVFQPLGITVVSFGSSGNNFTLDYIYSVKYNNLTYSYEGCNATECYVRITNDGDSIENTQVELQDVTTEGNLSVELMGTTTNEYWREDQNSSLVWNRVSVPATSSRLFKVETGSIAENPTSLFPEFDDFESGILNESKYGNSVYDGDVSGFVNESYNISDGKVEFYVVDSRLFSFLSTDSYPYGYTLRTRMIPQSGAETDRYFAPGWGFLDGDPSFWNVFGTFNLAGSAVDSMIEINTEETAPHDEIVATDIFYDIDARWYQDKGQMLVDGVLDAQLTSSFPLGREIPYGLFWGANGSVANGTVLGTFEHMFIFENNNLTSDVLSCNATACIVNVTNPDSVDYSDVQVRYDGIDLAGDLEFHPYTGSIVDEEEDPPSVEPTIDSYSPIDLTPTLTEGDALEFDVSWSDSDSDTFDVEWVKDGLTVQETLGSSSTTSSYSYDSINDSGEVDIAVLITADGDTTSVSWTVTLEEEDGTTGGGGGGGGSLPITEDDDEEDESEITIRESDNVFSVITGTEVEENVSALQMDRLNRTINLLPGQNRSYTEKIYNTLAVEQEVSIEVVARGESDWIVIDDETITIPAYDDAEFDYQINVPDDTEIDRYDIYLKIRGSQESSEFNINVNVLPRQLSWIWMIGGGLFLIILIFFTAQSFNRRK